MIGQHGIRRSGGVPPIRYDALETALKTIGEKARTPKSIGSPAANRLAARAGGEWSEIEPLIERRV